MTNQKDGNYASVEVATRKAWIDWATSSATDPKVVESRILQLTIKLWNLRSFTTKDRERFAQHLEKITRSAS